MSPFVFSAQDVTRTRLCAAAGCPDEVTGFGTALCTRHDQQHRAGQRIELQAQRRTPPPELECCSCHDWKPDNDFSRSTGSPHRRNRHPECKECAAERRVRNRAAWTPEQKQRERDRGARSREQARIKAAREAAS